LVAVFEGGAAVGANLVFDRYVGVNLVFTLRRFWRTAEVGANLVFALVRFR